MRLPLRDFPGGTRGKESTCQEGEVSEVGSIPGVGRIPGGRNDKPLQYPCLENPMKRDAKASQRFRQDWSDFTRTMPLENLLWSLLLSQSAMSNSLQPMDCSSPGFPVLWKAANWAPWKLKKFNVESEFKLVSKDTYLQNNPQPLLNKAALQGIICKLRKSNNKSELILAEFSLYCKMSISILNNLQPCVTDDYVQKENWSCPGMKVENKYLLFVEWLTDGLTANEWVNGRSPCSITSRTVSLNVIAMTLKTKQTKKTKTTKKKLPRNLFFAARMCSIRVQTCLHPAKPQAFQNLFCASTYTSRDPEERLMVLATMSSSTLWNKRFFWRRPNDKLNYFCYATANGERAHSSRWTII